jgi:hypothetical protein
MFMQQTAVFQQPLLNRFPHLPGFGCKGCSAIGHNVIQIARFLARNGINDNLRQPAGQPSVRIKPPALLTKQSAACISCGIFSTKL